MTIAELRERTGKTQEQVAIEVGITTRAYQDIESGKTNIRRVRDKTLKGLVRAFNLSSEELLLRQANNGEGSNMDDMDTVLDRIHWQEYLKKHTAKMILTDYNTKGTLYRLENGEHWLVRLDQNVELLTPKDADTWIRVACLIV